MRVQQQVLAAVLEQLRQLLPIQVAELIPTQVRALVHVGNHQGVCLEHDVVPRLLLRLLILLKARRVLRILDHRLRRLSQRVQPNELVHRFLDNLDVRDVATGVGGPRGARWQSYRQMGQFGVALRCFSMHPWQKVCPQRVDTGLSISWKQMGHS